MRMGDGLQERFVRSGGGKAKRIGAAVVRRPRALPPLPAFESAPPDLSDRRQARPPRTRLALSLPIRSVSPPPTPRPTVRSFRSSLHPSTSPPTTT